MIGALRVSGQAVVQQVKNATDRLPPLRIKLGFASMTNTPAFHDKLELVLIHSHSILSDIL